MADLPSEILCLVAFELHCIASVGNFRLVCRRWAGAGYPALAQHFSVLNTWASLTEFRAFLSAGPGPSFNTRKLTVYHGKWPVCRRKSWETHPLLFGAREKWVHDGAESDQAAEAAFCHYQQFISRETKRDSAFDADCISSILSYLPRLTTLTITQMQTLGWAPRRIAQFSRLVQRIWLRPSFDRSIQDAVAQLLPRLDGLPHLARLNLTGLFRAYPPPQQLRHIRSLHIKCLDLLSRPAGNISDFLSAFPHLEELVLDVRPLKSDTVFPVQTMFCPSLRYLQIGNTRISGTALDTFVENHSGLRELVLRGITVLGPSLAGLRNPLLHIYRMDQAAETTERSCQHGFLSCPKCPVDSVDSRKGLHEIDLQEIGYAG